ncbi:MAG: PEP-utilizing enzyme [Candidatus Nanoarchaeia archaeon]|nr:PEP-utilizing enzyme [Candidatus Nanoarchaeia archaeon]
MAEKSRYRLVWGDIQPHLTIEGNILSFKNFRNNIWNQVDNIIQVSRKNKIYCYHSIKDLENDVERGKNFLNKAYGEKFLSDLETQYNTHWQLFKKIKKTDFSRLTNKELVSIFNKSAEEWEKTLCFFRATQEEGTRFLIKELGEKFSKEEISKLLLPSKLDIANKEQIDWEKVIYSPVSDKILIKHAGKYPWAVMCHITLDEVLETLKQRYRIDKERNFKTNIIEEKKKLKKEQEQLIKKAPELKLTVELLQRLSLSRMEVKSCWAGTDFYLINFFKEVSKRTGEDIHELWKYYLSKNLENLLLKNIKLTKEEKSNRDFCFVGLWKNNKAIFVSGNQAEEIAKKELREIYSVKEKTELMGAVANPGAVVGVARILEANNVAQTRKLRESFKKGEILITQMTQPNIMDIASKAAALVTDEGGMLSHAAIISRELKIPCIVGTHDSTRTIKDGDLIEVDANKGIVKILKN